MYIYYIQTPTQVDFAQLKACFSIQGVDYCVAQPYIILTVNDELVHNEMDCPLLELDDSMLNISPKTVKTAQSIVHECTSTCKIVNGTFQRTIERESADTQGIYFQHDLTNKMYCFNVYCCKTLYL